MSICSKKATFAVASAFLLFYPTLGFSQVECWAPGMSSSITLSETAGSKSVTIPKPYRYDIFGVAGTLELGNRAVGAIPVGTTFKQKFLIGTGGTVQSTAYVGLQTGLLSLKTYPERLSISGTQVATSIGPIQQYGQNWTLSDPKNKVDVTLTFQQSGGSLLGSLLPGLFDVPYPNQNPKGHFYVMGEYHATAPVMTGTLSVSSDQILTECPINLSYTIQKDELPIYRPPFLGLDLGSANLTILGTPPATATPTSGGTLQATVKVNSSQVSVVVDLAASQGNGWKKTTASP